MSSALFVVKILSSMPSVSAGTTLAVGIAFADKD
jgi:hypothetical protein